MGGLGGGIGGRGSLEGIDDGIHVIVGRMQWLWLS